MTVGVGVFSLSFLLKDVRTVIIKIKIKAVIMIDADGEYIIHGVSKQTPVEMFKTMQPLWQFDPSAEQVHYVELEVALPGHEQEYHAPEIDAG